MCSGLAVAEQTGTGLHVSSHKRSLPTESLLCAGSCWGHCVLGPEVKQFDGDGRREQEEKRPEKRCLWQKKKKSNCWGWMRRGRETETETV